jgi:hypothetical protein
MGERRSASPAAAFFDRQTPVFLQVIAESAGNRRLYAMTLRNNGNYNHRWELPYGG